MTESEAVAGTALVFAAAVMTAAWLADGAGLPISPVAVLGISVLLTGVAAGALARARGRWLLSFSWTRLAAFAAVVLVFSAYISWLAWPSLLPITEGPDLVHHLTLIHFIQRHHGLPHDPALGAYLGEMASYTPGSHLLAALAGGWLRVDALWLVHGIQTVCVALKAGLIYSTLARLLPPPGNPAPAFAGTMLLLLPYRYLLEPITMFGFYSQVIAETFAVAVLWAIVLWHRQPAWRPLALASIFCVAVVLCWPVYLPATALAVLITVMLPWWRRERPLPSTVADALVALGPATLAMAIFSARHASSAGILRSGGSVLVPDADLFGWPFLVLCVAGVVIAIRRAATTAPVLAFAAACGAQIAALAVAQTWMRATNLYLANKTVFLLVNGLAIFGGLALASAGRIFRPAAADAADADLRFRAANTSGVVMVAALLVFRGLPLRPLESPFSEPVHRAGTWAKAHVPAACVDYMVNRWVTGYWLHLDVLGNARASERMRTETFEYHPAVSRWILAGGRPFAIVEDLAAVPADARRNMGVLFQSDSAAVVRRTDGKGRCDDATPSIDTVGAAASKR